MEFISKTEFRLHLKAEGEAIQNFDWDEEIPVNEAVDKAPEREGVLLLLDKNRNIIFVSTSNDLKRRTNELLNKSNGRFDETVFVQFSLETEYLKRFANRHSLKFLLLALEIGENNFENVLDDDDPRIVEKLERLQKIFIDAHKN
ncbi:hypothetical protein [Paenibacillus sp. FSL H3-0457]|uniref:hypothetical protein n=1 Tax=Paenibacillus sp. FSL H3-0457 TaxID=2921430 RepID=UPI0030EB25E1